MMDAALSNQEALDQETMHASRVFLCRIAEQYEPARALIFGSRARGDHAAHSDIDLAVIFGGRPGDRWSTAGEFARVAFDVLMETGVLIDPFFLWEDELDSPEHFPNPSLLHAILSEGRLV